MHVDDLLQLDALDLTLVWGDEKLLAREITGVTATDLEDPQRFVRPGEVVLTGLVWWRSHAPERAERFLTALAATDACALLAGEETHGEVPAPVVAACRAHRIPLLAVSPRTTFRAVTDAIYLRRWRELSRGPGDHAHALPESVRTALDHLLGAGAGPRTLLDRAFAHLGSPPCHLLTPTGRTVATTAGTCPLPAAAAAEALAVTSRGVRLPVEPSGSPLAGWHLYVPDEGAVPPRVLRETADVLARCLHHGADAESTARQAGDALAELLCAAPRPGADTPDETALRSALSACGMPEAGPYEVLAVDAGGDPEAAADALTEALLHPPAPAPSPGRPTGPFAVGRTRTGAAVAVAAAQGEAGAPSDRVAAVWPLLLACRGGQPLHGGAGALAAGPAELAGAYRQARYALDAARHRPPGSPSLVTVADLGTVDLLIAGLPEEVRAAYRTNALGPLLTQDTASHRTLLETLDAFFTHHCSWARTAEALHLHVNTVHYRIRRVETLTGRDLSRTDHRLDLYAALRCFGR